MVGCMMVVGVVEAVAVVAVVAVVVCNFERQKGYNCLEVCLVSKVFQRLVPKSQYWSLTGGQLFSSF